MPTRPAILACIASLAALASCRQPTADTMDGDTAPVAIAASDPSQAQGAPAPQVRDYAGWYQRHGGRATFQPCGQAVSWVVGEGADLAPRARGFGLQDDTPVYVRISGTRDGDVLDVKSVAQFGSPTPVRDCAMDGVVTQD